MKVVERVVKKKSAVSGKPILLYEYTHSDGTVFSGIYETIDTAHAERNEWLRMKGVGFLPANIPLEVIPDIG